jgi:hypothetical protein
MHALKLKCHKLSADCRQEHDNREIAAFDFFSIFGHVSDFIVLSTFALSLLQGGTGFFDSPPEH